MISFFFTPVMGVVALCHTSRKVIVTHYYPINQCPACPYLDEPKKPEICENCMFMEELAKQLSIKEKYLV